jgi:hypothetical protein
VGRVGGKRSSIYTEQYEIALSTFDGIRAAFPALTMNLDLHHEHVELALDIPAQPGLSFKVHLNLQNLDELHLSASALWVGWFPCTNPKKVQEYFEAVSGLLSGQFRILEHWRGKRAVKAELQAPSHDGWKTIATSVHLSFPWPRKSPKVVQNLPAAEPVRDLNDYPA